MSAKRYDVEAEPVEVTEEHLLTETGLFKNSTLNMNQVLDGDLSDKILKPLEVT